MERGDGWITHGAGDRNESPEGFMEVKQKGARNERGKVIKT